MQLSSLRRPTRAVVGVLAAVAIACTSTTADVGKVGAGESFILSLGATTVSVAPGGSTTTSIKAAPTSGLASAIAYTITGAPAGLMTSIANTSVPDSSTLTITASTTLAPAAYSLVVKATASGASAQQATVVVTVRAGMSLGLAINFVAAGAHTCALTTAGAAYCWGYDADGQLGNADTSAVNPAPVAVAGGSTFQSLSISKVDGVSCGLTTGGAAYCWGDNGEGQLGDGTTTRRLTPTPVAGGLTFVSIAVGNSHACGVATNGTAYCWGTTPNGAFGDGSVGVHLVPAVAAPGMTFQSIVAGSDYTCALTTTGAAYCWGLGVFGQLGNGDGASSTTPVAVSGRLTFRALAAGGLSVCGLTTSGNAYCWGQNFYGTLGDGTSATEGGNARRVTPVAVAGGLTFKSISAGYQTMCGVTDFSAGYCWGYNFGAVGDGTFDHRSTPVAVAGGLTFQSISSGTGHTCGVTTTNAVYCWGDNGNGELGDGTVTPRLTPALVRWPSVLP
jgi:alpha-tubulin suppressor-like RCC1 family protein